MWMLFRGLFVFIHAVTWLQLDICVVEFVTSIPRVILFRYGNNLQVIVILPLILPGLLSTLGDVVMGKTPLKGMKKTNK